MPPLHAWQRIMLQQAGNARFVSPALDVHAQTAALTLRVTLPTSANPGRWSADATLRTRIVYMIDGVPYAATGSARGRIHHDTNGQEVSEYILSYTPPHGFFGTESGPARRLGETAKMSRTVQYIVEVEAGSVDADIALDTEIAPAPPISLHHSATYDNASSTKEVPSADGILSWSHTGGANANRAVVVGIGNVNTTAARTVSSVTYGATTLDALWHRAETTLGWYASSGRGKAGIATGSQTVTVTMSGDCNNLYAGAVTAYGVDQTTPFGTAATNQAGTGAPTVTVSGVVTGDLTVDTYIAHQDVGFVGEHQTQFWLELEADNTSCGTSGENGEWGGVMSWTSINTIWAQGAVAFKQVVSTSSVSGLLNGGMLTSLTRGGLVG